MKIFHQVFKFHGRSADILGVEDNNIMNNQQAAAYALRFATFACDLGREEDAKPMTAQWGAELIEHAGYIQALAQEVDTLNRNDPGEVEDFKANWRMALNWWNKAVIEFTNNQDVDTQRRIELHMEAFWDDNRG